VSLGGGPRPPVARVADLSGARGHRTREPYWEDGGAASCGRRGATTRIAPSGRGRRLASRGLHRASVGCGGPERRLDGRKGAEPPQQIARPQRLGRRKAAPSHPRHRQEKGRHEVTRKKGSAHPRGKKEPSGSDLRRREPQEKKRRGSPGALGDEYVPQRYLSSTLIEIDRGLASSRFGSVRCSTPCR
jgi:hypothetical protein